MTPRTLRARQPELIHGTPLILEIESRFKPIGNVWNVKGLVLRSQPIPRGSREAALRRKIAETGKCKFTKDHDQPEHQAVATLEDANKTYEEVFYRVRRFEFDDHYPKKLEVENPEEDLEGLDHAQRVAVECDWFKNCVPREVTIS